MSKCHLSKYPARFPPDSKFKGISMPFLGLGTIWLGRRWPTDNMSYKTPLKDEIDSYLSLAYKSGIRLFDTAAAYGESERVLGGFFKLNPKVVKDTIIATKWGEEFDPNSETSEVIHTTDHLHLSLNRSLSFLPKVDILYVHKADNSVLSDSKVKDEMLSLIDKGSIKYTGASISKETDIERALEKDILWTDFIQTGADVVRNRPDIARALFEKNVAVVVNAPVRKLPNGVTPMESYLELADNPHVSFVLTGTRNHLRETLGYFE